MGFIDTRRPVSFDFVLSLLCPSGIIAYHGHRVGVSRIEVFIYAVLGCLCGVCLFLLQVRNKLLGPYYDNVKVLQAAMEKDYSLIPTLVLALIGSILIGKAANVVSAAFAATDAANAEKDVALQDGSEWKPPAYMHPWNITGIPFYLDLLLYLVSPCAVAGLYNKRRWGMVAGLLAFYRISLLVSGHVASKIASDYYQLVHQHIFDTLRIDIKQPQDSFFTSFNNFYDFLFTALCLLYSLYSLVKLRKDQIKQFFNIFQAK